MELSSIRDAAWVYVAGPLLAIAAVWITVRLGAPQLRRLAAGIRGMAAHDPEGDGEVSPAASTWLASAGALGAAGAIGAATAVSIGGAGVIGWVWLIGLSIAPLRYAEALLARTDAPGGGERGRTGSLPRRLMREGGSKRALGIVLTALVLAVAFTFVGGVHGGALAEASAALLPDSMPLVGLGVAALAAILAVGGAKRAGPIAGWLGLAAMVVLCVAAVWAAMSEPGRAFGALGRAVGEAFAGAPPATPFVGALAGEVAVAALVSLLPPIGATTGVAGAVHGAARARTTRGQAAAALVAPLVYVVVTTVLAVAFVATGAYYRRIDGEVTLDRVRVYTAPFETPSQRAEPERLHTGYIRIAEGETRDHGLFFGTHQGVIRAPRFEKDGEPADIALHLRDGVPFRILVPRGGVLEETDLAEIRDVVIAGEMLPRGGGLFASALTRGTGGEIGPRLALGALLLLLAVCGGVWGIAAGRSLAPGAPAWARIAVAILPAAGLALSATGAAPWLGAIGGLAAAALATLTALVLAGKAGEIRRLVD